MKNKLIYNCDSKDKKLLTMIKATRQKVNYKSKTSG